MAGIDFEVTIVGGGLVGASLACALKNQNLKVALIEKAPIGLISSDNLDARALALSLPSVQCLKVMDIWPKIEKETSAILEVHVSKQGYFGITRIKAKEFKLPALGYVVNADHLNKAINQAVQTLSNVTLFRPDEIIELSKMENAWKIKLNSLKTFTTKLLVAADGPESSLRKHQGIGVKIENYYQTAFVTNVELSQSHCNVAYERFTANGSIAMLPFNQGAHINHDAHTFTDNHMKCVWVVPSALGKSIENMSETEFLNNIQDNFGYRLGRLIKAGRRIVYPLRSILTDVLYRDRVVLIGNAANTLHPVAAQGFNMGLRDAATLAELLVMALQDDQDVGSVDLLRAYAGLRQVDHQSICKWSNRLALPDKSQWLGIAACELAPFFKHLITDWGLGRQQELPKLCRGVSLTNNREFKIV